MSEETEKETKKPKEIPKQYKAVRVVASKGQSALVEWADKDGPHRGYVPADKVEDGQCDADVLKAAIPYGVPWEEVAGGIAFNAETFARLLRARGIWTSADLERKMKAVRRAIDDTLGLTASGLHGAAREYEKGVDRHG